jgi:hypothetical protein
MTADQNFDALIPETAATADLGSSRTERVGRALARQLDLYRRLDSLSRRQGVLIDDDDTDGLLTVLGERQAIVDEIAAIGASLEPIRHRWEAFLQGLPASTREHMRSLVDALAEVAGVVAGRDEADRGRLELRRTAVGRELASVARGRSAVVAYGGPGAPVPFFQDREA